MHAIKSNLLIIFKSSSGYIFGGYSPCSWHQSKGFVQDDTLSSFLFSQTHNQIYPLKQDKKQYAIWCGQSYGPCFGNNGNGQHDIVVCDDFQRGYSLLGSAYLWDKYEDKRSSHLYGQESPNLTECEIFELQFS
ncbi:unnamed protein product [Paramecium octaurelia]|uniref:TLDc domain-containing protein n=1 Tax=Paramecium octaurelia TaxID=43137 RepID=A0A8S1YPG5_PAROT|nr:unnamed protein product [Paramecium octaurelia]